MRLSGPLIQPATAIGPSDLPLTEAAR